MNVFVISIDKIFLTLSILIGSVAVNGQQLSLPTDARTASYGMATVAQSDVLSANANPAALGHVQGFGFNAAVSNRFLIEELYDFGAYAYFDTHQGGVGLRIDHFAFEQFRQQQFALSYGRSMAKNLLIGVELTYFGLNQEIQGNASGLIGSIGAMYLFNDEFSIGLTVQPVGIKFSDDIQLPSLQRFGFSYQPSELVSFNGELNYTNGNTDLWSARIGVNYSLFKNVDIGLGYRSNPNLFTFGIAFQLSKGFLVQIASEVHQRLGLSPVAGFSYLSQ